MTKFSDINLLSIGNTVQMVGAVYSGEGRTYLMLFPEEGMEGPKLETVEMGLDEWRQLIKQADLLETEVLDRAKDGELVKVIMRKSARQVEEGSRWKVFQRDGYRCRYCGKTGVPLTVDHLICWESLGPTIEANLATSCKKCNKVRGETPYDQWLRSQYYTDVSRGLDERVRKLNEDVLFTLANISLRTTARGR